MDLLGYSCAIALFNCWNWEGVNTVSKNGGIGLISTLQAKLSISPSGFVEKVMMSIACVELTHISVTFMHSFSSFLFFIAIGKNVFTGWLLETKRLCIA